MKRLLLIGVLLLSLLPTRGMAKDYEAQKKLEHRAPASAAHTLDITNKYGDVKIQAWDKQEVWIDVTITVDRASGKEQAEKILDRINVEFSNVGNTIKAVTILDFDGFKNINTSFKIDYAVFVPKNISFILKNKYGNINVDHCGGGTNIDIAYGNLTCNDMVGKDATVSVAYGKFNVKNATQLAGGVKYSPMVTIDNVDKLTLEIKYSKLRIGTVKDLMLISKYGSANIAALGKGKIDSGYDDIDIDELLQSISVVQKYGSLNIAKVAKGAENITINSRYTNNNIGLTSGGASYQLEATSRYGKIKLPSNPEPTITHKVAEGSSTSLMANSGSGKPQLTIKIDSQYGDITIK